MSATASDPFFWNDWQGDPLLRLCSMAAQGFWMRLLCIAAESKKKGYVLINGRKPTNEELAKIAGQTLESVEIWLADLDRNGVYSKDRNGIIYNRKMVREAKKRDASRKGGKIGGRVTHAKQKGIFSTQGPTQDATQGVTQHPRRAPLPSPSPSPRRKNKEVSVSPGPRGEGPPLETMDEPGFAKWWKACHQTIPRRASRPQALRQWLRLDPTPVDHMIAAWQAYIAENARESDGHKFRVHTRAPDEWFRNRIHENFLADIRAREQSAVDRQRELAATIQQWNGCAQPLIERLSQQKFETIFLGSSIEHAPEGSIVIHLKTDFQATRAESDPAIITALEHAFPNRTINFMSPKRKSRAHA